jgi:hypothetical protein
LKLIATTAHAIANRFTPKADGDANSRLPSIASFDVPIA